MFQVLRCRVQVHGDLASRGEVSAHGPGGGEVAVMGAIDCLRVNQARGSWTVANLANSQIPQFRESSGSDGNSGKTVARPRSGLEAS